MKKMGDLIETCYPELPLYVSESIKFYKFWIILDYFSFIFIRQTIK